MSRNTEATRRAFLATHPGLGVALQTNHRIIDDIRSRFTRYGSMSDKQVALVLRLAAEGPRAVEKTVAAPVTGDRCTFTGKVVSAKQMLSQFRRGDSDYKMTVKVETADGVWLAWGTIPSSILADRSFEAVIGTTVEVTAGLKAGRDAHFALLVRPSGRIVAERPLEAVQAPVVAEEPEIAAERLQVVGEPELPSNIDF